MLTTDEAGRALMNSLVQFRKLHQKNKPQYGLHQSEIHMLFIIRQLTKNKEVGIKVTEISRTLNVSPPTVTQKLTILEEKGFINRIHSKEDRRKVLISISDEAKELIESMRYDFLQQCISLAEYLGIDQSEKLHRLLDKTYNFFNEYRDRKESSDE